MGVPWLPHCSRGFAESLADATRHRPDTFQGHLLSKRCQFLGLFGQHLELNAIANCTGSPRQASSAYSPITRRRCSSRISSAMLRDDSRTSSAKGACGRHERQDNHGVRLVIAASG
jgi:hypothetical protein